MSRCHFLFAMAVVAVIAIGAAIQYAIWSECRSNGSSVLYCLRMITR